MTGRRILVIKQKGCTVFPDEVQAFIAEHNKVQDVSVIGMPHKVFDEGIFAFVQHKQGVQLEATEILDHCKGIASYKRPQHVEVCPPDRPFPLTRTTKVDKLALSDIAATVVGRWWPGICPLDA